MLALALEKTKGHGAPCTYQQVLATWITSFFFHSQVRHPLVELLQQLRRRPQEELYQMTNVKTASRLKHMEIISLSLYPLSPSQKKNTRSWWSHKLWLLGFRVLRATLLESGADRSYPKKALVVLKGPSLPSLWANIINWRKIHLWICFFSKQG